MTSPRPTRRLEFTSSPPDTPQGPGGVIFCRQSMPPFEPPIKRTVAFIDGQNLFFAAREAFGYTCPNYDFPALAKAVCDAHNWELSQTRFYTGIPDSSDNPFWNHFWARKLLHLSRQGVHVFNLSLRYRNKTVKLPDGSMHAFLRLRRRESTSASPLTSFDWRIEASTTSHCCSARTRTCQSFARKFERSRRSRPAGSRSRVRFLSARPRRTAVVSQIPTGSRSTGQRSTNVSICVTTDPRRAGSEGG